MAKRKIQEKKPYTVKVPVYATEVKEGSFTYEDVISRLKQELVLVFYAFTISLIALLSISLECLLFTKY